jgi:hypothetical protein
MDDGGAVPPPPAPGDEPTGWVPPEKQVRAGGSQERLCPRGHPVRENARFCTICGQAVVTPSAEAQGPGQIHTPAQMPPEQRPPPFATGFSTRRRIPSGIVIAAAVAVVLGAVGIVIATTSHGQQAPVSTTGSTPPTQVSSGNLTTLQRAVDRCTVMVAAGVSKLQQNSTSQDAELESEIGESTWVWATINRANTYLDAAVQRIQPRQAALAQTVKEISYLCYERLSTLGLTAAGSTADASGKVREYLSDVALAVAFTGGAAVATNYFSGVGGLSGVTGIGSVSGFTGLSGFGGFTGASGFDSPGGFTGVSGSSGVSGVSGGDLGANSGGGFSGTS